MKRNILAFFTPGPNFKLPVEQREPGYRDFAYYIHGKKYSFTTKRNDVVKTVYGPATVEKVRNGVVYCRHLFEREVDGKKIKVRAVLGHFAHEIKFQH